MREWIDTLPEEKLGLVSRCSSEINLEPVDWIWPGRLAVGKHTCLAGEPGASKSQATMSMVAAMPGASAPADRGTYRKSMTDAVIGASRFSRYQSRKENGYPRRCGRNDRGHGGRQSNNPQSTFSAASLCLQDAPMELIITYAELVPGFSGRLVLT